jgi:hypothetical protein
MRSTRIVYGLAATYGFVSLVPLYFLLDKIGRDAPPALNHPEFYYGFLGVALLGQIIYVLMATDPVRYHPIMRIAVMEKFVHTAPVLILYSFGKVHPNIMLPSLVDPIFGILFIIAYFRTRDLARQS